MVRLKNVIDYFESIAPLSIQEDYDNSGLLTGSNDLEIQSAIICLDCTEAVVDEAISKNINLIISHHPVIFRGLKKLIGNTTTEKILIKAIKNNIGLYSLHTNLDMIFEGVNHIAAEKIGLTNLNILKPQKQLLRKLVTYIPADKAEEVRNAIFEAGAGHIGNYDCCGFNTKGKGSFRALENTNPYVGKLNEKHFENEIRFETIYEVYKETKIMEALFASHPYEEVAYDIYSLENYYSKVGAGIVGELENEEDEIGFMERIKTIFGNVCLRHSNLQGRKIKKVSYCGGAGSFLINDAIKKSSDVFITSDLKYHDFHEAENRILLVDAGHYETEKYSTELISKLICNKFADIKVKITNINTNSVKYFY